MILGALLQNISYSLVTRLQIFYSMPEYIGYAKMFFTFKMSQCKMVHAHMLYIISKFRTEETSLFRFSRDSQVQIHYIGLNQVRQYML
jgi:hypothetical protein